MVTARQLAGARAVLRSGYQADFGLEFDSGLLVADVGALRSRGIDVDSLASALAAEAASLPGVARVFTPRTLALAPPSDWNAELWRHMIPPDYGWLLCGVTAPGYVWSAGGLDAEHGSTNPEDVAVPIAFYGAIVSACAILALFFGQRMAKEYAGAAILVPYFLLTVVAIYLLAH